MVANLLHPLAFFLVLLSAVRLSVAATIQVNTSSPDWITYTNEQDEKVYLANFRKPALFTGDFGDCHGASLIDVSRFNAALYKDNKTVLVHWAGTTALNNQSIMMYMAVYAYGKTYWDLSFNPCSANIKSLCPTNSSIPIEVNMNIPLSDEEAASIPDIAATIPDFEGQAIMRMFANTSKSNGEEIGCFSARLTNGNTFSQPKSVGSILGIFAFISLVASFATTVYGEEIPTMRTHYAHSLSVLVVFAVYQHIFFTGALSVNWPSVLPAFWSNYAWSGGMIFTKTMQNSINKFVGRNYGDTSKVGAAGTGTVISDIGSGFNISQIYSRSLSSTRLTDVTALVKRIYTARAPNALESLLASSPPVSTDAHFAKRALPEYQHGFKWYGNPAPPGLPIPGNFSGFAGTLSVERIAASNAFMTGFLWFIILLVCLVAALVAFKFILEGLVRVERLKTHRLDFFRQNWLHYVAAAAFRMCFISFFMVMFLTRFQFKYGGGSGPLAIAAIFFIVCFVGMLSIAGYACFYRLRAGEWTSQRDRIVIEQQKTWKSLPWVNVTRLSKRTSNGRDQPVFSIPWWRFTHTPLETQKSVHEDEEYIRRFGWLASRFRRTRWWFFAAWLVYDFIRACVYAGAIEYPLTQVFCLLIVEIIAFGAIVHFKPFEGQRLNTLVVYCLGFSKIMTTALSAAFAVTFNNERISTTAVGVIIIVIQGILTMILMAAILLGAISTWFSLRRNISDDGFRPRRWREHRARYFEHIEQAAADLPPPPKLEPVVEQKPAVPDKPYFSVNDVKRVAKIEDEDAEFMEEIRGSSIEPFPDFEKKDDINVAVESADGITPPAVERREPRFNTAGAVTASKPSLDGRRRSRANSWQSNYGQSSLPYGARQYRTTWSRDLFDESGSFAGQTGRNAYPNVSPPAFGNYAGSPARQNMYSMSGADSGRMSRSGSLTHSRSHSASRVPSSRRLSTRPSTESFQFARTSPNYINNLNRRFSQTSQDKPLAHKRSASSDFIRTSRDFHTAYGRGEGVGHRRLHSDPASRFNNSIAPGLRNYTSNGSRRNSYAMHTPPRSPPKTSGPTANPNQWRSSMSSGRVQLGIPNAPAQTAQYQRRL